MVKEEVTEITSNIPLNIQQSDISDQMQKAYLDYAMSVIVSRALPDVRDGLKPVHRRIIYAMQDQNMTASGKFFKCASVVGEVMKKYHPHGNEAIYDSLVRMGQYFSLRYPLILPQGNFGCFTKDTKVKLVNGRYLSFEELVKAYEQGKKNYTYTVNSAGLIAIAEIKKPRLTIKDAELVKVVLDNGEEIRCTPNHRFMLKDGSYKEARDLQANESLMPIYSKLSTTQDRLNRKGRLLIFQNKTAEWVPAHHLADNFNLTQIANKTGTKKYFGGNPELVLWKINKNHKVVRVEKLTTREDVYDLTIDNSHNFALAAGVFVHNSIDGDPPAAMRYTECKMGRITEELYRDIDKETVDFELNDLQNEEPTYLPSLLPNLLLNGVTGIAVGMATNIPPHNLGELIDGLNYMIENTEELGRDVKEIEIEVINQKQKLKVIDTNFSSTATAQTLITFIKGPDFPTGGIIYDQKEIVQMYATGKGRVVTRAKVVIEESKSGKISIIVKEIPYQVNKATLITKIANLVKTKKVDGIIDLRDESSRNEIRIAIELKRGAIPKKIENSLYKYTELQNIFNANMVALLDNEPKLMTLKTILEEFIKHRQQIVVRRTIFLLKRDKLRQHILQGLKIALDNIDEIITLIRKSKDVDTAKDALIKKFGLTDIQTQAILDMQLRRLAALERQKIEDELKEVTETIKSYEALLISPDRILKTVKDEFAGLKSKYADERKTTVVKGKVGEISEEDLVVNEPNVITISYGGYIKRMKESVYRTQGRGGTGVSGATLKEEDVVSIIKSCQTHDWAFFFTNTGKVHKLRIWEVPEYSRQAKGTPLVNFLNIRQDERIEAFLTVSAEALEKGEGFVFLATHKGRVKKTALSQFENIRSSGIIAINLTEDDSLVFAEITKVEDDIMLTTHNGQSIKFPERDVRAMGRSASGVGGIKLKNQDDYVVGAIVVPKGAKNVYLMTVTEKGSGKKTSTAEYKQQNRAGSGILTYKTTAKTGNLVAARVLYRDRGTDLLIATQSGMFIRVGANQIPILGRATQGVRLIKLRAGDSVTSVAILDKEPENETGK